MPAVALALGASLAYGLGDFLGGVTSRRLAVLTVLALSQAVGLLGVVVWIALDGSPRPGWGALATAVAAGAGGVVGLGALYRGFAIGAMGIVAPVSALAPAVPLALDAARGVTPSALQAIGIAIALTGVVLVSRERVAGSSRLAAGALLAVVAALCFGVYLAAIGAAAEESVPWALAASRGTSTALALGAVIATGAALRVRVRLGPQVAAIGALDVAGNVLYATAATRGLLGVVAVLGSLYPVVTVALAHALLHERLAPLQWAGAAGALAGAALIAAG